MPNDNTGSGAQPITLRRWQVVVVAKRNGSFARHAWGHDVAKDEGCVTGAIVDFKLESMTVTTTGGQQYRLGGLPGPSKKGKPVWEEWCKAHDVIAERDVTNDYVDPNDVSTRQFVALNISSFSAKTE